MKRWLGHPVVIVVLSAIAVRLALAGLPLIITNDGIGYLTWGKELALGQLPALPANRTPGYPAFLGACFGILGVGWKAVLIAQHALGVVTSAVIAWSVNRRHGRGWSIAMGLVAALSPSLFVWECYALTESLAVCLMVTAAAMALVPGRWRWGLVLGAVLGAACLVRPAAQVMVPLAALGWWLGGERGLSRGAAVVAGCLAVTGPWAVYNAKRGVGGLAEGGGISTWMGFAHHGVLDEPVPESVRAEYEKLKAGPITDARVHEFLVNANAWGDATRQHDLSTWAWSSAASQPGRYVKAMARSTRSLLELRPRMHTDGGWSLWRLSQDGKMLGQTGPNFQVSADPSAVREFMMGRWERAAAFIGWVSERRISGLPQVALFGGAIAGGLALIARRKWGAAVVVLSTGAYFASHIAILQPWSRLTVPAWACWVLFFPDGARGICASIDRLMNRFRQAQPRHWRQRQSPRSARDQEHPSA